MALGWSISAYYRCAILVMLPNMLGGEGRGILLLLLISAIMEGPMSNIEKNIEVVSESVSCTVELQINHTKLLWKMMLLPMKNIILNMMDDSQKFGKGTMQVKSSFNEVNNQIISKEGYDISKAQSDKERNLTTQKLFERNTKMRCEFIVTKAIRRCKLWFETKHIACLDKIPIPIFNHLFCVPMVFDFMCNIMKVMNPWCKDRIPVDSNFGQLYDKVNGSVEKLNQDFTAEMAVNKTEQESVIGANLTRAEITQTVHEELLKKRTLLEKFISVIKLLISFYFFILFISAFLYIYNFNKDIRYDNIYISTYFRQIDARRRVMDRRYLLPLRKAEQCDVIFPWQLKFHSEELRTLLLGIIQYIPIILVLITLFVLDWLLFTMLDIIQRHSYLEYNFSESHHLEIKVRGNSVLANLIRRAVVAFNNTIDIQTVSNNLQCLPKPHKMKQSSIYITLLPMGGIILFCFLQVYSFRLRRVIAAFCFPKREKKRVLFLYNEWLRKRITYAETQRKKIIMQARMKQLPQLRGFAGTLHRLFPFLQRFIRKWCLVCKEGPTNTSYHCPNPGCGAMYCEICWKDVRRFCFNCLPFEDFVSEGSDVENNPTYAS
ncbi:E3 ubiquitin-protein ligase DCST1 [Hemitrygon akajei]|uniref:E3 ubiquitin-protein ligase DCST1 n=1 Tax=Hemitrygon akajei TaxID=2704970 RepID=UPI003BF96DE5